MIKPYITGYCDRITVRPGESLRFMASAEGVEQAKVQIVRLLHGDEHPEGPGFQEREVDADCNGRVALSYQAVQAGSFVRVADSDGRLNPTGDFTLHAFVWPTTPNKGRQAIIAKYDDATTRGYALGLDDAGRLTFWAGDGRREAAVATTKPLRARLWYFVAATYEADSRRVTLYQTPVVNAYNSLLGPALRLDDDDRAAGELSVHPAAHDGDLLLAGYETADDNLGRRVTGLYNGKIDRCGVQAGAMEGAVLDDLSGGREPPRSGVLARWDTAAGYTADGIGDIVHDVGPHALHGIGVNRPVRAMTGYNWRGKDDCFRLAPEQYGGIYFNDDAIVDCRWRPAFSWTVPKGLASGVYAARLRGGGTEDHIVFFVRPAEPSAKVAMLMPTASYLAYANEHFVLDAPEVQAITGHTLMLTDYDYLLGTHPEWGRSTYDHHNDGQGVCYTSYRRPIMGLRPKHRMAATGVPWQFPADLSIVWWLEQSGHDYDVITDEDLHRDGLAAIEPYNVVINGTHSEYYSERMLDAHEEYLAHGGRVIYTGANGYYWVVGFRDDEPWCMEVRKLDSGSRAWQAAAGEHYLATTGEKSGIWRNRGRSPQKTVGVGFASEGMDESSAYRKLPDAEDPAVSWVLDGVDGEVFGDNGLALGGAAGLELDRYDLGLGTPPGAWLLAASEGHSDNYPHVSEEVMFNFPGLGGTQDFQVRADMVLFKTRNEGAVFATGSIAFGQALPWNMGDNDCARIMQNVVDAFAADDPLPGDG
ncbi:N,N-dimethylformamidase beta subunit family domain-containing protein [Spectribacter hydrogenooxidans]|uniref:LamG-like jellyroll fold domain-containing protein n=1 Tax=Spectribacter hydrogenoxidans TaxID=3075608 RepID=A0ABU3C0F2_9GAMM|nr:N,N-dimethylformamidase beta subunit family domain-containing protein [Salinisphaera sp. W335]MDT0634836.1 LamG-like jellyroll fold domain-containing protein [Salinisphaera sp. W335]